MFRSLILTAALGLSSFQAVSAHGVGMRYCTSPAGDLRVFIEHWHDDLSTATGAGTVDLQKNSEGIITLYPSGIANNGGSNGENLGGYCLGGGIPALQHDCSPTDAEGDWVYFDFPNPTCGAGDSYTFYQGNTVVLTESCSSLYPQTIMGSSITCTGGGSSGDPHFKTWSGEWYDFHGLCDLALLKAQDFANGLGLNIQIRTKARYQYSYIEAAAVKIGDDILEVGSFGEYWFNGVEGADLTTMGNDYDVTYTVKSDRAFSFFISTDPEHNEGVEIKTFKDLVSVNIVNATYDNFGTSAGMMGAFKGGAKLGRDGVTVFEDLNAFGSEWQVAESEPQIFVSPSVYAGNGCAPPSPKKVGRRLGEGVSQAAAEKACAHFEGEKFDMCVFDVQAMADLEVAEIHGAF